MTFIITLILVAIALVSSQFIIDVKHAVKFSKVLCKIHDPIEIVNETCWAKPINRTCSVGNVRLFVTKPFHNVFLHIRLYKRTEVKYRQYVINVQEDYCAFFEKNHQASLYLKAMYKMYEPYSNLNHSCPYHGEIIIKDIPGEPKFMLSAWPAGDYRLDVIVLNLGVKKFTMEFYVDIKEIN